MIFSAKHPRLAKELRPLLLPWVVAVVAGGLPGFKPLVDWMGFENLLGLAAYGFLGGLALLAVVSFGTEFHERTLPLLLTQPRSRSSLWNQKLLTVTVAVVVAVFAETALLSCVSGWWSQFEVLGFVSGALSNNEVLLAGVFLLATVCSCGFWTLVAGSTIGGLVFTVAAEFGSAMAVAILLARIRGQEQPFQDPQTFLALVVTGVVYSAIFLWLGWRKFVRLEVRNTRFGEGAPGIAAFAWKAPWSSLLISRPTQRVLNLVRKELRLQKPIFQLAAVFAVCWLATILLQWLRPKQNITYLFDVLTCVYAPLSSLLAGCVSLGEEKVLGLTAQELTLPFSPRLQWLLKLVVCAATAAVLSLGLPLLLFWTTGALVDVRDSGLMNPKDNGVLVLGCISALVFLLGYWAISLTGNTVHAALVAVGGLVVGGAFVTLGSRGAMSHTPLESGLLTSIMVHFQLPPDVLRERATRLGRTLCYAMAGGIILLLLRQSLVEFRRSEERRRKLFQYSLTLAGLILLLSFWSVDTVSSIGKLSNSWPVEDLRMALNPIVSKDQMGGQKVRVVSAQELKGRISEQTELWLRNASISYRPVGVNMLKSGKLEIAYEVSVVFPNGRSFSFVGGYSTDPFRRRYGF